jgi:hypothetical protein
MGVVILNGRRNKKEVRIKEGEGRRGKSKEEEERCRLFCRVEGEKCGGWESGKFEIRVGIRKVE